MVTFNGRITLPTDIRKQLGLKTGDNIEFVEVGKGRFEICPRPIEAQAADKARSAPFLAVPEPVAETVQ
jgi:AbrB family looped-hinge helix DNA binding protein